MWIVRLALRRPYTFVVAAMLVALLGIYAILNTPTDIFPNIDIPVISVAFNFEGMPADEMEKRVVGNFERILTTTVNDIEHIESQALSGRGIIKIYFQKGADIAIANAQVTAISQTATRMMPPGIQPPLIIQYSASSVPILQLSISSKTLPEQSLFDYAVNGLRPKLVTIPGVQIPYPYGGKQRQIMVDLEPEKLYAYGISPADVSNAVNAQNLILPAGTSKIGKQEYPIRLNASPDVATVLNDMPIKTVKGSTIYIRDVAHVRDGFQVQTNVVHSGGKAGVLLSILKNGNASTLDVVKAVKEALPGAMATLPKELEVTPMFDQSVFVRASVEGVVKEAAIAAGLTGLMILLFLGSWRSTLIVVISIPLSILVSIIVLHFLGETLNVMTLGGMALAVGILVDDATVEIENIHRNLHQRKRLVKAILDGAQQIAVPAFVSTLCICIVFVPVVFISGAAKYLFTPLAMAVVFAMMTSYLLSRTLVPTMVHYLLAGEVERYGGQLDPEDPHAKAAIYAKEHHGHLPPEVEEKRKHWLHSTAFKIVLLVLAAVIGVTGYEIYGATRFGHAPFMNDETAKAVQGWMLVNWRMAAMIALGLVAFGATLYIISTFDLIWRVHDAFNVVFEKLRRIYGGLLAWALEHRAPVAFSFIALAIGSLFLIPIIGQDFFPSVDAGQLRLHVRAPAGTRLEETERYYAKVIDLIRETIPPDEIDTVLDNMGIPNSTINLSLSDGSMISPADGEILVSLKEHHKPTADYQHVLRKKLEQQFPQLVCFFQPSDIATQVLNFGLPASIDVQVTGPMINAPKNAEIAKAMLADIRKIPGAADLRMAQVTNAPDIRVNVDRTMADQLGLTQKDVATDMLISLSGTAQQGINFWLNPKNAVNYTILVQTPQYRNGSVNAIENTPLSPSVGNQAAQLLGNVSSVARGVTPTNATHYNISPTFDVQMGVAGTDLGSVGARVQDVVNRYQKDLPRGSTINLRGQIQSMRASFVGLGYGLIFAVVLVYLLMVINFQSWIDPLIILMALPGALAGILWMLFATHTTISVPALMGAIMSIGVATANSILMITFANDQRQIGKNAHDAALAAGLTRLRPVIMTALAMIIGMLPMSLGLGEGGEQNAPLGRAVIGGLLLATFTTLFFVPVVYSALRRKAPVTQVEEELR
ncbi:MAG TPA: efflux RND transporter permease subunit [Tepidisphaeraceae bacterium]|jgi:multidrug efflux pump subunit AcrB|nr:efflux RND transporter permease subunit [Tepidisphaeraceae bacterium]